MSDDLLLDDLIAEVVSEPGEGATAYLRACWLWDMLDALLSVRQRAGLTQSAVAERMGTTQSSVARMERDLDGGYSVRRLLDYAVACGVLPDPVRWRPIEACRQAALNPDLVQALTLTAEERDLILTVRREQARRDAAALLADTDRCCAECSHLRREHDDVYGQCMASVIDGTVPTWCGCAGWVAPSEGVEG